MEIKVGEFELFTQGSILSIKEQPIDFILNKELGFIVRVSFKEDSSINESTIDVKRFEKVGAELIFINFNNPIGMGSSIPVKIGTYNKRELFLSYRIYELEGAGQTFHYNWLFGKEVENA